MLMGSTGQMMKESTIASSRTEADRAKKRYAKLSIACFRNADIIFTDSVLALHMCSSQKMHWPRREDIVRGFPAFQLWSLLTVYVDKGVVDAFQNAMSLLGGV